MVKGSKVSKPEQEEKSKSESQGAKRQKRYRLNKKRKQEERMEKIHVLSMEKEALKELLQKMRERCEKQNYEIKALKRTNKWLQKEYHALEYKTTERVEVMDDFWTNGFCGDYKDYIFDYGYLN